VVCLADSIEVGNPGQKSRRAEIRLRTNDVRGVRGARSTYGAEVKVLDISSNGILIETGHALAADSAIALELLGAKGSLRVPARVLRCQRFYQGDIVWYQSACRFKRPVNLNAPVPRFLAPGETRDPDALGDA
jgi:hypothetical protein